MRLLSLALLLAGCKTEARSASDVARQPSVTPPASAPSSDAGDPAPHWHSYPEIPPDDLSRGAQAPTDNAGEAVCTELVPPPPAQLGANVHSGPPITNRIPPELVMAPIRARAGCFRTCYERELAQSPQLSGRVVTQFVIDRDGWVRKAHVREADLPERVARCVSGSFVGLRYPEPPAPITIVYPLSFAPRPL